MFRAYWLISILNSLLLASWVYAAPVTFVYEGVLEDGNGPITTTSTLILRIYDKDETCLLYEEQQTLTPETTGAFSVRVGSEVGSSNRTVNDPGLAMNTVFLSSGTVRVAGGAHCTSGYTATSTDGRRLLINVNGTDLSPSVEISAAPFAMSAETSDKVGTYAASKILRTDGATALAPLTDAKATLLMNLLNGSLGTPTNSGDVVNKSYVDTVTSNVLTQSSNFSGDVTGLYNALALTSTGVTAGVYGSAANIPVITVDAKGRVTQISAVASSGGGTSTLASGMIFVGNASNTATAVTLSGDATLSNSGALSVTKTTTAEADKILALDNNGFAAVKGLSFTGPSISVVKFYPPTTGGGYSLRWPASAPTSGQTLQSDGVGNLSWASAGGGGGVSSVTANSPLSLGGTSAAPEISLAGGSKPFLKWSGSAWTYENLNISDLKNTLGTAQFPTNCTVGQTLFWSSALDKFECATISVPNMATESTQDISLYVSAAGNDSLCNGSVNVAYSAGAAPNCAVATLQAALDKAPDIIRHIVTIEISSNLTLASGAKNLARIEKVISAHELGVAPMLVINGNSYSIDGIDEAGATGLKVLAPSRGVHIKNMTLKKFKKAAVAVEGGLAVIEGVNFIDNTVSVAASGYAQVMLAGNVSIALPGIGTQNTGIEIFQATVSTEAALNIDLGTASGSRGVEVSQGEFAVQEEMSLSQSATSVYQTGIDVSVGGRLGIEDGKTLVVTMSSSNTSSQAVTVRGGHLEVSGSLRLTNVGGRGLSCEHGANCHLYGNFTADGSTTSSTGFILVNTGSTFISQGDLQITATENSAAAAIEVAERSLFKYSPYQTGKAFLMTRGGVTSSGSTALRIRNASSFVMDSYNSPAFNVSNYDKLFEATEGSQFSIASAVGGTASGLTYTDESSRVHLVSGVSVPMPKRLCPGSMTASGRGRSGSCMDSSASTSGDYYSAVNACSLRGLRLCTKKDLSIFCASGGAISTANWVEGGETMTCSASSMLSSVVSVGSSAPYRCCE